jgi:hypothetical protein
MSRQGKEAEAVMTDVSGNPHYWRIRADETRAVMREANDPRTLEILEEIALAYERAADRAQTVLRTSAAADPHLTSSRSRS